MGTPTNFVLAVCLLAAGAGASAPPALSAGPAGPFDCASGSWILKGAVAHPAQGVDASFSPDWQPTLEGIAACTRTPAWRTACVTIQGHTDAIAFNDPTAVAFGGVEAAQLARGRGRSTDVLNRLYKLGVTPERLRELPPASEPDYRGVALSVVLGCVGPRSNGSAITSAELRVAVRDSVREELTEQRRQDALAKPPPPVYSHHFWAEANLLATLVGTTPDSAFGPALQIGAGWNYRFLFARADVGFAVGTTVPQRTGYEFGAAAGYFHARWLQVGVVFNDRLSASNPTQAWLEQTWAFGVEGTHCLWRFKGLDLCAREAVLPLGGRTRRGEEVNGQLFRIPDTHDSALRFELGASVRKNF